MLLFTSVSFIKTSYSERRNDISYIYLSRKSGLRSRAMFYVYFFNYLAFFKALPILNRVILTSNLFHKKLVISLGIYMYGLRESWLYKAVSIGGVTVLGRLALFGVTVIVPNEAGYGVPRGWNSLLYLLSRYPLGHLYLIAYYRLCSKSENAYKEWDSALL